MYSAKTKKGKGSNRRSSSDTDDDETFTVPMSLAEEEVNLQHDMVVSSLANPKRTAPGNQQTRLQDTYQPGLNWSGRKNPGMETYGDADFLAATKLEEKPQPSQSQPSARPSRPPYRSLRLSAGRRQLHRSMLHTVPSDPTNEDDRACRALDALSGMVRANPNAWPTTAICMALLCPQSRHRIMPRYGKQFWEDAAEAVYGPADR